MTVDTMSQNGANPPDIATIIVAAGHGSRFGDGLPKQYHALLGRPVLAWTLDRVLGHGRVQRGVLVVGSGHVDRARELAADHPVEVIVGADTRQESVALGLEALAAAPPDLVLVHDGVRPNPSPAAIDRVIDALATTDGAIAAMPLVETIKRDGDDGPLRTVDRSHLYGAQTPQGFRFPALLQAYRATTQTFTDDAALAVEHGLTVNLVEGNADNLKITRAEDLQRMARLMGGGETRVGSGYDVHRLGPGDHVVLCGVRIAHDGGLIGHSDADVGLHALTDALLGALALGDIGSHFPPSDAKWKGAASDQFVTFARDRVSQRGFGISHVDITLICETPKIGPHRAAMIGRLEDLLGIEADRISVKATTTERLGFTGRGEGIAAQAVATITSIA